MCILFIYTNPTPSEGRYRLIIASNRDEYLVRPAAPAHHWAEDHSVIGGLDLEPGREGGTWLGMSLKKKLGKLGYDLRVGVLLNVTGEARLPGAVGRGCIVTDYLRGDADASTYISDIIAANKTHNAFSFVAVELDGTHERVHHYSNAQLVDKPTRYESGSVLGFGNSLPDAPLLKVQRGKERFDAIVRKHRHAAAKEALVEELVQFLRWGHRHMPDAELSRRAPDRADLLSSVFVDIPGYGTRTHTVILVDWEGHVDFVEKTMKCPISTQHPEWVTQHFKAHL